MTEARMMPFATLLTRHRRAAGLTQEELAERAGVSVRAISDLERGIKRRPHRETVALLAEALALTPERRAAFERAARPHPEDSAKEGPAEDDDALGAETPEIAPFNATTSTAPDGVAGMLLSQLTPMVGREREEALAVRLVRREGVRLVTLTGAGGVGKTRLAIQVADALRTDFPDGVWFVRLARLTDPLLVIPTIAQALGVQESGSLPIAEAVRAHLAERQALVVLDNCEQVATAAPDIVELLGACLRVKALVTSRTPLGVRGEQQLEVLPLALPHSVDSEREPNVERLVERLQTSPAVVVFVQRAQAVLPSFALTPENAHSVAEICRRLDGLPLALELAAAWIKLLPPAALLARLDRRLPLLTGRTRDLPFRQQSMARTIAWTEDLLSRPQQRLFRRLAIFIGGATLEAIETVCGSSTGDDHTGTAVLDGLSSLVDHSLVQQRAEGEEGNEPRFGMLQVIREYALERLEASSEPGGEPSGEAETLRRAHATYFLALADQAATEGPEAVAWLDRLEREHDNLRAALGWAHEQGEVEMGLELASRLWRFWDTRGHLREGQAWVEGLLALGSQTTGEPEGTAGTTRAVSPKVRANALRAAGRLALWQGDYTLAERRLEEGVALDRAIGRLHTAASSLSSLGVIAMSQGNPERAAIRYTESLALMRELGDPLGIATALNNLGDVALGQGDLEQAEASFTEAVALLRAAEHRLNTALCLANLGAVARRRGDFVQSEALLREGLALSREIGYLRASARIMELLANTYGAAGKGERAALLLGASAVLRETIGSPQPPQEQADVAQAVAAARAALGEAAWAATFRAGQALPLEAVLAEALGEQAS